MKITAKIIKGSADLLRKAGNKLEKCNLPEKMKECATKIEASNEEATKARIEQIKQQEEVVKALIQEYNQKAKTDEA